MSSGPTSPISKWARHRTKNDGTPTKPKPKPDFHNTFVKLAYTYNPSTMQFTDNIKVGIRLKAGLVGPKELILTAWKDPCLRENIACGLAHARVCARLASPSLSSACASAHRYIGDEGFNYVKLTSSEQLQILLEALGAAEDPRGSKVTPFKFAEDYDEMRAVLMAKDKPVIQISDTNVITGRYWPLEHYLKDLGFIKLEEGGLRPQSTDRNGLDFDANALIEEAIDCATSFGWRVERA